MSATIEERLAQYPDLSDEERHEVERYVAEHPEWAPALADAKALDALFEDARGFEEESVSEEVLAFYAASRDMPNPPEELAGPLKTIRMRVDSDPDLKRRLAEIDARRNELEEGSPANEQFERLTGRTPDAFAGEYDEPKQEPAHIRYLWRAAAAVVVLAATYSILYKAGQMMLSEAERLARFDREELAVEGFGTVRQPDRGVPPSTSAEAYLAALRELRQAQESTIGLFPRFNTERVSEAEMLLGRVIALEPEDSFLAGEATYLLAKVRLASGDIEEARTLLQQVIASRSRRAEEAESLLQRLQDG